MRDTKFKVMNSRTSNKLKMYEAVLSTIQKNQSVWEGIPVFVELVETLQTKIAEVNTLTQLREADKKWVTKQKDDLFIEIENRAYALSFIMRTYGKMRNRPDIEGQFSINKRFFTKGDAKVRLARINQVIEMSQELSEDLIEFGLSPEMITELVDKRNQLNALLFEPRNIIVLKKKRGLMIDKLIRSIDDIIHTQIFSLLKIMENDHPEFVIEYTVSKIIVDRKGKRQTRTLTQVPSPPGLDDTD